MQNSTTKITTVLDINAPPPPDNVMAIVCSVAVTDTINGLNVYFKNYSGSGYFTYDSIFIDSNQFADTTLIFTANYITSDTGLHLIYAHVIDGDTINHHSSSIFLYQTEEEGMVLDPDSLETWSPEILLERQNDTLVFEEDTFVTEELLPQDTFTFNDDSLYEEKRKNKMLPDGFAVVEGQIMTENQFGSLIPLECATVIAKDSDNTGENDIMGGGKTDLNGMFRIGFLNTDGSGTVDLYFKIYARNGRINVCNAKGSDWYRCTSIDDDIPNGIINYGQIIFGDESAPLTHRVGMLFLYMHWGWMFANGNGHDPGRIHAHYPKNNKSVSYSSYTGINNDMRIRTEDAFSPDIVLHEYAHNIMYNAYDFDIIYWQGRCPDEHNIYEAHNTECAWTEGWADYFPLRVFVPNHFDNRDGYYGYWNESNFVLGTQIANPGFNNYDYARGSACESRVAGLLHDLDDAYVLEKDFEYNEDCDCADCPGGNKSCEDDEAFESCCDCPAGDAVSVGFTRIYDIIWGHKMNTVLSFYNHWVNYREDTTFFLAAAHHNTIDFDLKPDISPPNNVYLTSFPGQDTVPQSLPDVYLEPCQESVFAFAISDYIWDKETWDKCDFKYGFCDVNEWDPEDGISIVITPDEYEQCTKNVVMEAPCRMPLFDPSHVCVYVCDQVKVDYGSFDIYNDGETELTEIRICYPGSYKVYINGKLAGQDTTGQPPDCPYTVFVPPDSVEWFLRGQDNVIAFEGWGGGPHLKGEFIYTIETSLRLQTRIIVTNPGEWYSPKNIPPGYLWYKNLNELYFPDTTYWENAAATTGCPQCKSSGIFQYPNDYYIWDNVGSGYDARVVWRDCICEGDVINEFTYKPQDVNTKPASYVQTTLAANPILNGSIMLNCLSDGAYEITVQAFDIQGRYLNSISLNQMTQHESRIVIPVEKLIPNSRSGIYFLRTNTKSGSSIHKIIVFN